MIGARTLSEWVDDARRRTLELVADLDATALLGPKLRIVNPPLWEIGHIAWFQERWVLRHALGEAPLRGDADALFDSAKVAHDTRWDLPLYPRPDTLAYLARVRDLVLERLAKRELTESLRYFVLLSIFHEDMHGEALLYTRQTHGYRTPTLTGCRRTGVGAGSPALGDVAVPATTLELGAAPGSDFVFDNEKWAHPVDVAPFRIARTAVTQGAFAEFVRDGGYGRPELWTNEGREWRANVGAELPVYWRARDGGFERRVFDRWVPLEPELPMLHVNAHEAEAWCRWAHRRLPTEAEWELAASFERASGGKLAASRKRTFPWGSEPPSTRTANLDATELGAVDVSALDEGDSALGCRQLVGNVWEWTSTAFGPYPGFVRDPYEEYSAPWFGDHRVLRGGCFATRARLLRNSWRNFYTPDRCDVWAGFRTCAID